MMARSSFLLLLVAGSPLLACGPWFPDTVLDQPQAVLQVPRVCYEEELVRLFPGSKLIPLPNAEELQARQDAGDNRLLIQLEPECRELLAWWRTCGIDDAEAGRRADDYRRVRRPQLEAVASMDFRSVQLRHGFPQPLPGPPLVSGLPDDVALSLEATRLLLCGETDDARRKWREILARPAGEKKFRAAAAAWMLAKTSTSNDDAMNAYRLVRAEVAAGAQDLHQLAPAAAAWLGPRVADPKEGLHLLATAWREGRKNALIDLRRLAGKLLEQGSDADLAGLAADPLCRRLLCIEIFTRCDALVEAGGNPDTTIASFPYAKWLAALEADGAEMQQMQECAGHIAWALYASGQFRESRRWLDRADAGTAEAQWLHAKFSLREGKLQPAARSLERALTKARHGGEWCPLPDDRESGTHWLWSHTLRQARQGHLLSDIAVVAAGRGEYLRALDTMIEANYWEDAAYLAESVLTVDELVSSVRKISPEWSPQLLAWWQGKLKDAPPLAEFNHMGIRVNENDPLWCGNQGDGLRYLLGRRLARESRFREARGYMPQPLLPPFDELVSLRRAANSEAYHGSDLSAILWRQAVLVRKSGMELLGTENAPDGLARYGGAYTGNDFSAARRHLNGWRRFWDDTSGGSQYDGSDLEPGEHATPRVLREEIRRADAHAPAPCKRFHYRYTAAELACRAAALLPDNSNAKAYMLNTAGQWLASRDPKAADKYYQLLVRRNTASPIGQAADRKRWFLSLEEPPDMPALPAALGR